MKFPIKSSLIKPQCTVPYFFVQRSSMQSFRASRFYYIKATDRLKWIDEKFHQLQVVI